MSKLLQSVTDLETSVQQLNKTQDLQLNANGDVYNVLNVTSTSSVSCDKGQVRLDALCVNCPKGTHGTNLDTCLPCPYGEYQDGIGAETCKKCPKGLSTAFKGSSARNDCSVAVPVKDERTVDDEDNGRNLGVIIGCTAGAMVLCGIVLVICMRKHLRSKAKESKMGSLSGMNLNTKAPSNVYEDWKNLNNDHYQSIS